MLALNLAGDGRILSATFPEYAPAGALLVEVLPEGNIADYRYADGSFVYDPLPVIQPEAQPDIWDELAAALKEGVEQVG